MKLQRNQAEEIPIFMAKINIVLVLKIPNSRIYSKVDIYEGLIAVKRLY